jgi:hypothetical protein
VPHEEAYGDAPSHEFFGVTNARGSFPAGRPFLLGLALAETMVGFADVKQVVKRFCGKRSKGTAQYCSVLNN